ncbi:MAG: RDD family protein [Pseudomonadota bacterium]
MTTPLLDTTLRIETPEGVELTLPVAGLASRALAWLLDAAIKAVGLVVTSILLSGFGEAGIGLLLIIYFGFLWGYNVLFEVLMQGQTLGKRSVGIRVVHADGTPVGWRGASIRNLLRPVDVFPGCYLFGCLSVLLTKNFQRLGDLAAATIVVHTPKTAVRNAWNDIQPLPPGIPLTVEEQEAIVSFGERRVQISDARSEELAAALKPLLGETSAAKLHQHAAWLTGRRAKT